MNLNSFNSFCEKILRSRLFWILLPLSIFYTTASIFNEEIIVDPVLLLLILVAMSYSWIYGLLSFFPRFLYKSIMGDHFLLLLVVNFLLFCFVVFLFLKNVKKMKLQNLYISFLVLLLYLFLSAYAVYIESKSIRIAYG